MKDLGGQAIIENGSIVIRIAIDALPQIVEGAWASGNLDTRLKVTDKEAFAKSLVAELNDEDELGTTLAHEMFDKAINNASEQGADGIEERKPPHA